jgi:MinD superfamily P-loop ATPase
MPEILVISGKGGTGKTTLTAAFAHLAHAAGNRPIICDLDVDAPDLHLLLDPQLQKTESFVSGHEAVIDPEKCEGCGRCAEVCRFDAVLEGTKGQRDKGTKRAGPGSSGPSGYRVDPMRCEGCKLCVVKCPAGAIDFPDRMCGHWHLSDTRFGPMVHAQLLPGEENSGRLVTLLRQKAGEMAQAEERPLVLSDGPPGIGCPVISSLSGIDLAVIVTEPTPSGRHDLERIVDLCDHFRVPAGVIINKQDLNPDEVKRIDAFCESRGLHQLGRIDYDTKMVEAMVRRQTVTEYTGAGIGGQIRTLWQRITAWAHMREAA